MLGKSLATLISTVVAAYVVSCGTSSGSPGNHADGGSLAGGGRGALSADASVGGGPREFTPCKNSLDCGQGTVCDIALGRCAECSRDADCGKAGRCVDDTCRLACTTDKECTPSHLLCDFGGGYCAECLVHSDCAASQYCAQGRCHPDVCAPGEAHCQAGLVVACGPDGSALSAPTSCGARQTCRDKGTAATCEPWLCTAAMKECDGNVAVACSDDGLSVLSRTDCAGKGQTCLGGVCSALVCPPAELYCRDGNVWWCASDGTTPGLSSVTCTTTQYCKAAMQSASCAPQVCKPGIKVCGATCNTDGSGYVGGAVPCPAGQDCVGAACVTASPCGSVTCPGSADRCTTVQSECAYMADTTLVTSTAATILCQGLGAGWSLCKSATACNAPVLAMSTAACGCDGNGGVLRCESTFLPGSVSLHASGGAVTVNCTGSPTCVLVGGDTAAPLCCHP